MTHEGKDEGTWLSVDPVTHEEIWERVGALGVWTRVDGRWVVRPFASAEEKALSAELKRRAEDGA